MNNAASHCRKSRLGAAAAAEEICEIPIKQRQKFSLTAYKSATAGGLTWADETLHGLEQVLQGGQPCRST
jgi:hypothetical protein